MRIGGFVQAEVLRQALQLFAVALHVFELEAPLWLIANIRAIETLERHRHRIGVRVAIHISAQRRQLRPHPDGAALLDVAEINHRRIEPLVRMFAGGVQDFVVHRLTLGLEIVGHVGVER